MSRYRPPGARPDPSPGAPGRHAVCDYCGAAMRMVRTAASRGQPRRRFMPLDVDTHSDGSVAIDDWGDAKVIPPAARGLEEYAGELHHPHFYTCPDWPRQSPRRPRAEPDPQLGLDV